MNKTPVSLRLSDTGRALLVRLAEHHGISQASVVEMLLRREAREQRIPITTSEGSPDEEPSSIEAGLRICSIGYQERAPEELVIELIARGVDVLVDVRETPWSHRSTFSRTNLERTLREAGIRYIHAKFAGNPKSLRRAAASHRDCLVAYRLYIRSNDDVLNEFSRLIGDFKAAGQTPCLFCYERHPDDCHRSILLDEWMRYTQQIFPVEHLATEGAKRFAA